MNELKCEQNINVYLSDVPKTYFVPGSLFDVFRVQRFFFSNETLLHNSVIKIESYLNAIIPILHLHIVQKKERISLLHSY